MSIVQAIDVRISGVDEEIRELEEQLDGKRSTRERLQGLRDQATSLDGEGGGLPDSAPPPAPAPKPAKPKARTGKRAGGAAREEHDRKVLAVIAEHPDGVALGGLVDATGLSGSQVKSALKRIRPKIRVEGSTRWTRYFPTGEAASRPNPAPPQEKRAAPARKSHARRNTEAAEAHNALRGRVKDALLQVLEEGPMGKDRATGKVLDLVPEASADDVGQVRGKLLGDHVLEIRANKLQLSGVDRAKPITNVEREVVESLGSGRTAREIAANCELVRDAFSARTILSTLVSRGVIVQRPDSDPPVYEAPEQLAEAA